MNVYFENETDTEFEFPETETVARLSVESVACDKDLPEELDVNILVVDSETIREINRYNRNIDSATDVLSFPYFEFDKPGVFEARLTPGTENILGDIILCADKIISQAKEYGHSQKREMSFLIVHSMLHLLGYDHIEESDGEIMRAEEKRLMEIIGIGR